MRQRYESTKDRSNQQDAIERFCAFYGRDYREMPPMSEVDYAITHPGSDRIVSFAEVKCRNIRLGQYPDIMLSWKKLKAATGLGLPVLLIVRWEDALGWYKLEQRDWKTLEWGGRTAKTRDKWDVEPVIKVANGHFQIFEKNSEKH